MHSEWIFNQIESLKIKKKITLLDFASGNGRNSIPLSKKLRISSLSRAVSSVGRASRLHREGRRFETVPAHHKLKIFILLSNGHHTNFIV